MLIQRLNRLLQLMPYCETAADIGTDHAYLARSAVKSGRAKYAIGTDLRPGPLQAASREIQREGLTHQVSLRQGFGLSPLAPGEASTVVIAGMGGHTIREILAADLQVARGANCLLLQPNKAAGELRSWLLSNGFFLCHDDLVRDGRHSYQLTIAAPSPSAAGAIVVHLGTVGIAGTRPLRPVSDNVELVAECDEHLARLGSPRIPPQIWLELGPFLLETRHPLLVERLTREITRITRALDAVKQAKRDLGPECSSERAFHRADYRGRLDDLRKVREWLSESTR